MIVLVEKGHTDLITFQTPRCDSATDWTREQLVPYRYNGHSVKDMGIDWTDRWIVGVVSEGVISNQNQRFQTEGRKMVIICREIRSVD